MHPVFIYYGLVHLLVVFQLVEIYPHQLDAFAGEEHSKYEPRAALCRTRARGFYQHIYMNERKDLSVEYRSMETSVTSSGDYRSGENFLSLGCERISSGSDL